MKRRQVLQAAAVSALAVGTAWAGSYQDFFKAVERDDALTVTRLLRRGFDPNSRSERGDPALNLALREDALAVVAALWAHPGLELEAETLAGETPLMLAGLRGHVGWMQRLIQRGARIHRDGWSPLHYAASGPSVDAVRLLLEAGSPVDAASPNGSTPLMLAAGYGSLDAATMLLRAGADASLRNARGLRATDFASQAGREGLAKRLQKAAGR